MTSDVTWVKSASKHGVEREDAIYAIENAIRTDVNFTGGSNFSRSFVVLAIGPDRQGTRLLEVLFEVRADRGINIFHAMKLRASMESRSHGGKRNR